MGTAGFSAFTKVQCWVLDSGNGWVGLPCTEKGELYVEGWGDEFSAASTGWWLTVSGQTVTLWAFQSLVLFVTPAVGNRRVSKWGCE